MIPAEREATQRFDAVDVLRGLSIVAVVLHHSFLRLLFPHHDARTLMPKWLGRMLFLNGAQAVTIFFAVSGFLITYTCIRRFGSLRDLRPGVFYRIRFARIAPLLLLVLLVLSMLHLLHADGFVIRQVPLWRAVLSALTFHLNWLEAAKGYLPANWDVLWSLSVEEMFYAFFPLLCLALLRFGRTGWVLFIMVLLAFVAIGPFARTVWTSNEIWQEKTFLGGMDAIALGCLTALLVAWLQRRRRPSDRILLATTFAGIAVMVLRLWPFPLAWRKPLFDHGVELLPLGVCLVMFGTVLRNRRGRMWSAPLRWFGRHSYEVYLTHEFVVVWITMLALHVGKASGRGLHHGLLAWIALVLLLSAPLGWTVAKFFSETLNRRLRRSSQPA